MRILTFLLMIGWLGIAQAQVELAQIFGDHMVLQRNQPVPVWGWADPGATVVVAFAGQEKRTKADAEGAWQLRLEQLDASAEPRTMIVTAGEESVQLQDVLVGEVWLCSGQSNMAWTVSNSNNAKAEIAAADLPLIRHFRVMETPAIEPQVDLKKGAWQVAAPGTVGNFTAVGFFFGRHLHEHLGVPIGLINSSWGGTVAEAWTSQPALLDRMPEDFTAAVEKVRNSAAELEKQRAVYQEAARQYHQAMGQVRQREKDEETAREWADPSLDSSDWLTVQAPTPWEKTPLGQLDGIVWYRKVIEVPADWAGQELTLQPGPIDEVDVAYVNGIEVGRTGSIVPYNPSQWREPRDYTVPGQVVKAGRNVIAIRVFDLRGQGGLCNGRPEDMVVRPVAMPEAEPISLAGAWQVKVEIEVPQRPRSPDHPNRPGVLFNSMIKPLIPYAMQGAIWYQGEANAGRPEQYQTLLPTMITDWRSRWQIGEFPFLIVQLANYRAVQTQPSENGWASLREAQSMTARDLPNTAIASAIDIGEAGDIHPRNKQEVGRRLGLLARAMVYGEELVHAGPLFRRMEIDGQQAILHFDHVAEGLQVNGDELKGFAIKGAEGDFVWAQARIDGATVVVWSDQVETPVAVRYSWANNPIGNLVNSAGLPADPFRTDGP